MLAVAERAMKALGEPQAMREAFASDVVWRVPGKSPVSGDHKGVEGVLSFLAKQRGLSDGTFHAKVIDVLAGESTAAVYAQATGKRPDGRRYDATQVMLLTVRDGKVSEARLYNADPGAFERFWA